MPGAITGPQQRAHARGQSAGGALRAAAAPERPSHGAAAGRHSVGGALRLLHQLHQPASLPSAAHTTASSAGPIPCAHQQPMIPTPHLHATPPQPATKRTALCPAPQAWRWLAMSAAAPQGARMPRPPRWPQAAAPRLPPTSSASMTATAVGCLRAARWWRRCRSWACWRGCGRRGQVGAWGCAAGAPADVALLPVVLVSWRRPGNGAASFSGRARSHPPGRAHATCCV